MSANVQQPQPGIFLVDKPAGVTSHDVVARARRVFETKKVGHAGTLDPMATGLLLLGIGPATRLLTYMVGLDKVYTATIRLGQTTETDDRESDVLETAHPAKIAEIYSNPEYISNEIRALTGEIMQVPSAVSAIKVDGQRAYDLVRKGKEVSLKARQITIFEFSANSPRFVDLGDQQVIDIDVRVHCSSGTYIRALARDLGAALGVGAHLTELRREKVGEFDVADATSPEVFARATPPRRPRRNDPHPATLEETPADIEARLKAKTELHVLSPADAAAAVLPKIDVSDTEAEALGHGKKIKIPAAESLEGAEAAAISPSGALIAIVETRNDGAVKVKTGFPQPERVSTGQGSAQGTCERGRK